MIWKEQFECMSAGDLKKLQGQRLKKLTEYVYKNCSVYYERLEKLGIDPSQIKEIDDIRRLPFTTKLDMRDYYPFDLFSVPRTQLNEIHVSSGTTGNPTLVGYTKEDIALWKLVASAIAFSLENT